MINYPFADADWLAKDLPKTRLYRRVSVGLLTLGHLRTAEAVGVSFLCGKETFAIDWGLLITIAQYGWRTALKKASKPNLWWILKRDYNTPRTTEELSACIEWFKKQNYFPSRTLLSDIEMERIRDSANSSINHASTAIQRLSQSVCRIKGWKTLANCDCVWDIPMVTATHLLVANAELDGAYHIPYDLIRLAVQNG